MYWCQMRIRWLVRKMTKLHLALVPMILGCLPLCHAAETKSFDKWLAGIRNQALSQGISQGTVETALSGAKYLPEVMDRFRNQPEFKLTLDEYLTRVVPENRIFLGRKKLDTHRALLDQVYNRCQVEPQFLVALWGIESDFGQTSGTFPVIDALATLAYGSSRTEFFRKELFHALHIVDQGHIPVQRMKGSWAGAMGQLQFMPSTFQSFAVDYDGDGKIDIWDNLGDALFSAANYLSRSGWCKGQGWGMEVKLPKEFNRNAVGSKKPMSEWRATGARGIGLSEIPETPDLQALLVAPDPRSPRAFLVYPNYQVILKWNRSDFFALAVGMLADQISPAQSTAAKTEGDNQVPPTAYDQGTDHESSGQGKDETKTDQ